MKVEYTTTPYPTFAQLKVKEHEDTSVHTWEWLDLSPGEIEPQEPENGVTPAIQTWNWNTTTPPPLLIIASSVVEGA